MKYPYSYIKENTERIYEYSLAYCSICDRIMQFDMETNQCVLCGSDNPCGCYCIGRCDELSDEIDKYWLNNKETTEICILNIKCEF